MKQNNFKAFSRESILGALTLVLPWGGIFIAEVLQYVHLIEDAGTFFWGCIAGSLALAALALTRPKMDIVALLTPVYAVIIFLGIDIPVNLALQILFSATLTILLIRLWKRF